MTSLTLARLCSSMRRYGRSSMRRYGRSTVRTYGCSMDTGIQIYRYGWSTFLLRAY